jgi:uncharacterized metal-binding protein
MDVSKTRAEPGPKAKRPLVYSCSGCSNIAQMANYIAVRLDRRGEAQMSCIAGVGGDVPSLVKLAKAGRPIIATDGCPLHCVRFCLARHGIEPTLHYTLTERGLKKRFGQDFDHEEAERAVEHIAATIRERKSEWDSSRVSQPAPQARDEEAEDTEPPACGEA